MPTTQAPAINAKQAEQTFGQGLASREKYWKELKPDEKIERMRTLVKALVTQNDELRSKLTKIESFVWEHSHEEDGKTFIKVTKEERYKLSLNELGATLAGGNSSKSDDVYI